MDLSTDGLLRIHALIFKTEIIRSGYLYPHAALGLLHSSMDQNPCDLEDQVWIVLELGVLAAVDAACD